MRNGAVGLTRWFFFSVAATQRFPVMVVNCIDTVASNNYQRPHVMFTTLHESSTHFISMFKDCILVILTGLESFLSLPISVVICRHQLRRYLSIRQRVVHRRFKNEINFSLGGLSRSLSWTSKGLFFSSLADLILTFSFLPIHVRLEKFSVYVHTPIRDVVPCVRLT